jgi:holo-[acyl-carrier protein] synthase
MELKTGVDLVEIERLQLTIERYGERFLQRVFTEKELAEVGSNTASLAARFAAKEAVAKALGTGIGVVSWHEIEIQRGPAREPRLYLSGAAYKLAVNLGLQTWSISLSHTRTHAIAMAVAIGNLENPDTAA